jgi:HD-like signal output (HDOD) protein
MIATCIKCHTPYRTEQDVEDMGKNFAIKEDGSLQFSCRCQAMLLIRSGKFRWLNRNLLVPQRFQGVTSIFDLNKFPWMSKEQLSINHSLGRVASPKELAALIKPLPLATARVLGDAEIKRRLRGHEGTFSSVDHAIAYIGLKNAISIVRFVTLHGIAASNETIDVERFWSLASISGLLAEHVTEKWFSRQRNFFSYQASLAGSLCGIGKLVTGIMDPALYNLITTITDTPPKLCSWREATTSISIPDHVEIGEMAAALWGMPEFVMEAIAAQDIYPSENEALHLNHIVAFANQLTHWVMSEPHLMDNNLLLALCKKLGLTELDCAQLVSGMLPEVTHIQNSFAETFGKSPRIAA